MFLLVDTLIDRTILRDNQPIKFNKNLGKEVIFYSLTPSIIASNISKKHTRIELVVKTDAPVKSIPFFERIVGKNQQGEVIEIPNSVTEFLKGKTDFLNKELTRFVGLVLWRLGIEEQESQPEGLLYWSLDGKNWNKDPRWLFKKPNPSRLTINTISNEGILEDLIQGEFEEPISYNIFRQAKTAFPRQPGTALILSYLAAEVAIKDLVCTKFPGSEWYIMNAQSPTMANFLRDFFHDLPGAKRIFGESWKIPEPFLKKVTSFSSQRNNLIHQGKREGVKENARKAIQISKNIIWLCEILKGHEWARAYLDDEAKKTLGILEVLPNK